MRLLVRNIVKKFGNLTAVNNCSLELDRDGIYGLIGPNGSGKTTMFNVISGFLRPEQGQIIFGEKNIARKNPISITKLGIARTFQLPRVFSNLTVEENLEASTYGHGQKIQDLIEIFNLKDVRNVRASAISYGQKKELELAKSARHESLPAPP